MLLIYVALIWCQCKITKYNTLNVNLSNLQLNEIKSGIKNDNKVNLNPSSNMIVDSNDEINFPHKSLLTLSYPQEI